MKEINQRVGGVAINWITIFLQVVISLFFIPFFLNTVGDKQYGLYSFSTSLISWADVLMVSIASAYFKFLTREKKAHGEYGEARACGVFFKFFFFVALLVLVLGLVFDLLLFIGIIPLNEYSGIEKNQICILILMSLCSTTLSSVFATAKSYPYYKQKYIIVYSLSLAQLLVQTGLSVLFLKLGLGVVFVALSHFGTAILVTLLLSLFSKKRLGIKISLNVSDVSDKQYRKKLFLEIFVFSSFVLINTIVDMLNKSLDKILLGFYNADSVSTYQLAYTIPSYLISITSIISVVNIQKINEAFYHGGGLDGLNETYLRVSKIQTIVTFLLVGGFLAAGKEFISLWLDNTRIKVYYISCVLMLIYSLTCSNALGVVARRIRNCHIKASIIYLGIAVSNIASSILFINLLSKENAIWGCVLGTVITYIVGHYLIMQIYDAKVTKLKTGSFFKVFILYLIISLSICVFINRVFELIIVKNVLTSFIIKGMLYVFIYMMFLMVFERDFVLLIIKKIGSKIRIVTHRRGS